MSEEDQDAQNSDAPRHEEQEDYEVGYGKPPVHSQFKKGNPGRPKGSSKRSFSMSEIIAEAMTRRLRIRRGDKIVSMQVGEIYAERLIAMATTGSHSDMAKLLTMIAKHAPHLLAAPELEAHITYHRAPGSKVELPPAHFWKGSKR